MRMNVRRSLAVLCGVSLCLALLLIVKTNAPSVYRRYRQRLEATTLIVSLCRNDTSTPQTWNSPNQNQEKSLQKCNLTTQFYCQQKAHTMDECLEFMLNHTVVVNAMSSNHYKESYNLFGWIQKLMPRTKIIVYDLGLTAAQINELRQMCNLELRTFQFNRYPAHVSPQHITNFAWKPLIVKEVSLEYEIVVWADTSIRCETSLTTSIFPYLLKANLTYVGLPFVEYKTEIIGFTHDGTIAYMNLTRKELAGLGQLQAGFGVYWMTDLVRQIVDEWVDCAMHEECIAPKGAIPQYCPRKPDGSKEDPTCRIHRFDQSALDLILYKHVGRGLFEKMIPLLRRTCSANRGDVVHSFNIRRCCFLDHNKNNSAH